MDDQSIFPILSIDRDAVMWEEYLRELTPVQKIGGTWWKREDLFAPLGVGSVNGSKMRQCLWLIDELLQSGASAIATGASLLSPQHAMVAVIAKHFGVPSVHVVGATNPASAVKHPSVAIAKEVGASFDYIKVAYNPALQRRVQELVLANGIGEVQYGITLDHRRPGVEMEDIRDFHLLGANQVQNLPQEMETLIIPAGSCNSFTSIMYGLAIYGERFPNLKRIIAVGIGPSKLAWAEERLAIISSVSGRDAQRYVIDPMFEYHDLHARKIYKYSDRAKANYCGIELHETYEAKCWNYLMKLDQNLVVDNPTTCFWIVGSALNVEITRKALNS